MIRGLWRRRNRFGGSRGVSSIIGAVFLVIVMFIVASNIFVWTMLKQSSYSENVMRTHQLNVDQSSEIAVSNGDYSVVGDTVEVNAALTNESPIPIQILTLWVVDATIKKYNYTSAFSPDSVINFNPGDSGTVRGSVTISGTDSGHAFNIWYVTARGNRIPLEEQGIITAELAQGIGYLSMDFDSFRYFEYESDTKLKDYPDGIVSFDVPQNKYVAFGCPLTNLDPLKRTIAIDSHSLLWVIIPTSDVAHNRWWYIANVAPDGTISPTYSTIYVAYGEKKMLVFASANDLGLDSFDSQSTPKSVCTVPVFLLLHGTIGGAPYGQNLAFVSLYFS